MIYRVDSFEETKRNPITGKAYDSTWIVFVLNHESYTMLCGSIYGCAYALKVSKKYLNWKMSMCDFLSYHDSVGKNIILAASEEDYQSAREEYAGHSCRGPYLRDYEAPILVHSTTTENYQKIMRDGAIKSWNVIKRENHCAETEPISRLLGDPAELRDYILFGSGVTGEIVVSSKQKHKIEMDPNKEYRTGARLYFDMKRIAEDGFLVRDGGEMKVKDVLPLTPYLLWAATWDKIGLPGEISTPLIFAQTADRCFQQHIAPSYEYEAFYQV